MAGDEVLALPPGEADYQGMSHETEQTQSPETGSPGQFPQTRWSMILRIQQGGAEDLESLCSRYWYPLYVFARRQGNAPANAEDLTQGFFAKLLEREWLGAADKERGKLRTFILTYFKRYIRDEWHKERAEKRGGKAVHIPIDRDEAEERYGEEPSDEVTPEDHFDRAWAETLLGDVMAQLRDEFVEAGKSRQFERLQQCLGWNENSESYATLATELGISEAGVKSAVHRLRKRYRQILVATISDTLADHSDVDSEIDYLFQVFS